ncbi:MAG TPA: DUF5996 family protein [Candidatus Limnocylindria bacterium]
MSDWLPLPYREWHETRDTLHLYTQIVGSLRLALAPFEPHWMNVPLYLTSRGLTTSPMPVGSRTLDAEIDFIDSALIFRTSDGGTERRPLGGAVADLYADVGRALRRLDVEAALAAMPSEVPDPIPFAQDRTHHVYDPAQALRFWRLLARIDTVLKEHRAAFFAKSPPVSFFWGSFDLAVVRVGTRRVAPRAAAGTIERFGATAEQICAGWWPGDARYPDPAFYAYAWPKPAGVERVSIRPPGAGWNSAIGEFVLPYEVVRTSADPRAAILEFLRSTYEAGATLLSWPDDLTRFDVPADRSTTAHRRG